MEAALLAAAQAEVIVEEQITVAALAMLAAMGPEMLTGQEAETRAETDTDDQN